MDFTVTKYKEFLEAVSEVQCDVYGISEWFKEKPDRGILIRHDVDRYPRRSLKIAELEAKHNIFTTYYFRIVPSSFHPNIIKKISDLGHEIGYHYEDLSLAGGDYKKAQKLFREHLEKLRKYSKVKTIAMHGKPLSKYDNKDLWNKIDFRKYGIESEAFLSIDYRDTYYFTDTGRSWSNKAINLRDKMESLSVELNSTEELIEFIKKNRNKKIAITTHPERWNDNSLMWLISYFQDTIVNIIKRIIQVLRK